MERGLSLLIAAVMLFVAPGVQAADSFTFAINATVGLYLTLPVQYDCDHGDLHGWSAFVKHTLLHI